MEQMTYCRDRLPEPGNRVYHIVSRYIMNGQQEETNETEYYLSAAQYRGDGLWQEYDEIYFRIGTEAEYAQGMILPSEKKDGEPASSFKDSTEKEMAQNVEVVAYLPFPEFSDLLKAVQK